jgi:Tfp pilus assembly protein PilN
MIRINLLPRDIKAARATVGVDKAKVVPLVCLALILVSCVSSVIVQGARLKTLEQDVAAARAESEQYKKTIALINQMVAKEKELNRRLSLVTALDKDRFRTVRVMDEVARRIPRYMWLTSLKNVSPERVAIDGYAFSNLVVSDLMSSLDNSEMFSNVELTVVKRKIVDGQNTVNFTVTSAVKDDTSPANES